MIAQILVSALSWFFQPAAPVANFKLMGVSGKEFELNAQKDVKGIILVFTSNHCPFARAYQDRVAELHQKYAPLGFPVVAINSNDAQAVEEDDLDHMKATAKEKNMAYEYLKDSQQEVAKGLGAQKTPHVFVLNKSVAGFAVEYSGGIDDNSQEPASVTKKYVEDAVNALLAGKTITLKQTKPVGCSIKWKE